MDQLRKDEGLLRRFDMIISHCERLMPIFRRYCKQVEFIDHNNKYALPEIADYKEKGYVLWIGGCQYVAYLVKWLKEHPIKNPVKILTDYENDRAREAANHLAKEIGVNMKIQPNDRSVSGHEIYPWSERLQYEMMTEAKAAIDVKGTEDFNQKYKPPTKAQKYIASGIPFAINTTSYSTEYFKNRGFNVPSPENTMRWFSKSYWEDTVKYAEGLRKETSIEAVGKKFRQYIESVI